jgi:hypothetical protein
VTNGTIPAIVGRSVVPAVKGFGTTETTAGMNGMARDAAASLAFSRVAKGARNHSEIVALVKSGSVDPSMLK